MSISRKRSKVKKLLKPDFSMKSKYKTTYTDIKKYFNLINEVVFENLLSPFNDVKIKQIRDRVKPCWGQVVIWEWKRKGARQYHLEMLPAYPSKKDFIDTLAHEMIHLFQMSNLGDTGNHNETFYSYRPTMKQLGINI